MLTAFRTFAKSKWAVGLLALLALGLLFTGGQQMDILGRLGPQHVISAGDRSVSPLEFRADMTRIRDEAQRRSGQNLDWETLIGGGQLAQYLRQTSEQLGFMDWAWKAGVRPGKELILRQIRQASGFFDSVTGQFSQEQYQRRLAEANLTPEVFEEQLRDQVVTQHFGSAVGAGLRMPRIYGAVFASQAGQTRDGRWIVVTQAMAGRAGTPTEAQLNQFLTANGRRLPEMRSASLVLFDNPADMQGEVAEARVQERFNFRRDALSQPERRTFVTLTAPNRAAADRIAAALRAGQTPQAVGAANNLTPTPYQDTPRSAIGDQAVAAGVFGLAEGQVSAPIQASVGFVVAQVTAITPGRPATIDDVRAQVIQELRAEDARAAVYRRVEAYQKARDGGKTFEQAVAEAGGRIVPVTRVTREGRDQQGRQLNDAQRLLDTMWSLGRGAVSDVVDLGQGQYFAVRVDEIVPAALPRLADVREEVTQAWTAQENARLLTARANELERRVRAGEDLAVVAASVGATVQTAEGVRRQDEARGQGVLAGLYTTGAGDIFARQQSADSFVVGRTDRINAPNPTLMARDAMAFRERMLPDTLNGIGQSAIRYAAESSKASFNEPLARETLGLPAEAPATPAGGAAGAPAGPAPAPAQ